MWPCYIGMYLAECLVLSWGDHINSVAAVLWVIRIFCVDCHYRGRHRHHSQRLSWRGTHAGTVQAWQCDGAPWRSHHVWAHHGHPPLHALWWPQNISSQVRQYDHWYNLCSLDPLSPSREGLADVISIHEVLTNQILLFHFETEEQLDFSI